MSDGKKDRADRQDMEDAREMAAKANDTQVGGDHYKKGGEEHWDRAWRLDYDCFQYIITKWVERWKFKDGLKDLRKAQHAITKYIEVVEAAQVNSVGATLDDIMYKERPSRFKDPKDWTKEEQAQVAEQIERTNPLLGQIQVKEIFQRLEALEKQLSNLHDHWQGTGTPQDKRSNDYFTYEGGKAREDYWTCKACNEHFTTWPTVSPQEVHKCNGEAGPEYVDQG